MLRDQAYPETLQLLAEYALESRYRRRMCLGAAMLPVLAYGVEPTDQEAIRKTMVATWDKPDARLQVGPVVVVSDRAIAGWTQGDRGGRALLGRDARGQWQVTACGGDGLREARILELTGSSTR